VKRLKAVCGRFPSTDIKVRLYDGSFHEVDSSEMAFKMAGSMAFKEGVPKRRSRLQQPIMKVEVVVPRRIFG
jgi:elongation factor G